MTNNKLRSSLINKTYGRSSDEEINLNNNNTISEMTEWKSNFNYNNNQSGHTNTEFLNQQHDNISEKGKKDFF